MASFWTAMEQAQFATAGSGQVTLQSDAGRSIMNLLKEKCEKDIKTIVEIGTWNGLGSTMCIIQGMYGKDVRFWSLECNKEKHDAAVESLSEYMDEHINLLWGSIVDIGTLTSESYLSNFPALLESNDLKEWFKVDLDNCMVCPKMLDELPKTIDFLLLDGGEYTTLYEFSVLFGRCTKYIALDDTKMDKCIKIHKILTENPDWSEIVSLDCRNGFSIFEYKPS
jgi:hypothetical protein